MAPGCRIVGLCVLVYLLCVFKNSRTFNIDTEVPIIKQGKTDSLFGFAVSQHQYTVSNKPLQNVLLIGAPNGSVSYLQNITRPGAIYSCPVDTTALDDCKEVVIGEESPGEKPLTAEKTEQWLGVTVSSQGLDGSVIACAHRYKTIKPTQSIFPTGICYIQTSDLQATEQLYEPSSGQKTDEAQHQYGYCQAGASGAITKTGKVLMGAPGVVDWRGALFKSSFGFGNDKTNYHSREYEKYTDTFDSTPPVPLDSYLGFSVAYGTFGAPARELMVAGAPRAHGYGQVTLFWQKNTEIILQWSADYQIKGEKFGSMFGFSLATLDFNGDSKVDLVVGAPSYFNTSETRVTGAVYIYLQPIINKKMYDIKLLGPKMTEQDCKAVKCYDARFGHALANLGDINNDQFEDLAVGAPYEGNGVIYIYNGNKEGHTTEYSQRITAESIKSSKLTSFGSSLSGGFDLDGNSYKDLLVGAYGSDKAILLRTRPVVEIAFKEKFVHTAKDLMINPKEIPCSSPPNVAQACVDFTFCFQYSEKTGKVTTDIPLTYTLSSDTGRALSRVVFGETGSPSVITKGILIGQGETCYTEIAYLKNDTRDVLHDIIFELKFELTKNDIPKQIPGGARVDLNDYPVIKKMDTDQKKWTVVFVKDCGNDNRCLSELTANVIIADLKRITAQGEQKYEFPLGTKEIKVEVDYQNNGEAAYEAELHVEFPSSLKFVNIQPRKAVISVNNTFMTIPVGNPFLGKLPNDQPRSVRFTLRFNAEKVEAEKETELVIRTRVSTTSEENNPNNDVATIAFKTVIITDAALKSYVSPDQAYFEGSTYGESAITYFDQIGQQVNHSYEVQNLGVGTVYDASVIIAFPHEVANSGKHGKHLFYPEHLPVSTRPKVAQCRLLDTDKVVNPLNVLNRPKPLNNTIKYTRKKRETVVYAQELDDPNNPGRKAKIVRMDCRLGTAKCIHFVCLVSKLDPGQTVFLTVVARLWNSTFLEDYTDVDYIEVYSHANISINNTNIIVKQTDLTNDKATARTRVQPVSIPKTEKKIAIWIIVVSAVAGVLLLVVLVIVLWKLGFFRRNRPEELGAMHEVKVQKHKEYEQVNTEETKWHDPRRT